jgi:hypothetical protein
VWAERLLYWLERRRDERFELLDGRRATLPKVELQADTGRDADGV